MNYLKEIEEHGRYMGLPVKAVHRIGDFTFIECRGTGEDFTRFSIFVDGESVGLSLDSLDYALLAALAYKHSKEKGRDFDAWRYAARVLGMEG